MSPTRLSVKSLRERLGLTSERFAEQLGASGRSVRRWENGHSSPSNLAQAKMRELQKAHDARLQDSLSGPKRLNAAAEPDPTPTSVVPARVPPQL